MTTNLSAVLFAVCPLLLLLLQANCQQVLTAEPHDVQEKQAAQVKRRLSTQSAGELRASGVARLPTSSSSTSTSSCGASCCEGRHPAMHLKRGGCLPRERAASCVSAPLLSLLWLTMSAAEIQGAVPGAPRTFRPGLTRPRRRGGNGLFAGVCHWAKLSDANTKDAQRPDVVPVNL